MNYKLKRFLTWPYRATKSSYLCIRFPFLYPRNRFTGNHYDCWALVDYHRDNYQKAYRFGGKDEGFKAICIDKWWAFKIKVADFLNDWVLQIFHCVPTYTELDGMDGGWRKAFGIQMCKEIKRALLDAGGRKALHRYRIMQIKEKYGSLRWYDQGAPKDVNKIVEKYGYISEHTCVNCGRPADYITSGYILPYCEKCIPEKAKESADKFYYDIPFYGIKTVRFDKKEEEKGGCND